MSNARSAFPSDEPVRLSYTRCGAATASALAIQKGWLQAEFDGPDTVLESLRDSESLSVRNSHYHHGQSGMFREGGNIPPIWARGTGRDTVVVAITWLDEYQGILVREDSPIRELADLEGKRLGIPRHRDALIDFQRGAAQHGFASALGLSGAGHDDVRWIDLDAPGYDTSDGPRPVPRPRRDIELEALRRGTVDAIFLRFAHGYRASREAGLRELINLGRHPDPIVRVNNGTPRPVTTDRAFAERHPDIVARYLAVLLRTARWAEAHHDEVVQLLVNGEEVTPADVVASHGVDVHRSFTPSLSPGHIAGLTAQKDFLRDFGYVEQDFDVMQWIAPESLARAHRLVEAHPELVERSAAAA